MYKALGGGNFAQAKLAQYHHVLIRRRVCHKSMAHPLLCYLLYNPRSIVAYSKKGII